MEASSLGMGIIHFAADALGGFEAGRVGRGDFSLMVKCSTSLGQAFGLKVEQVNWCKCYERDSNLQRQYVKRLSGSLRQPLDREVSYDRYLSAHKQLPDVGRSALIGLTDNTVDAKGNEQRDEGGQRHCHR